jgi:hypothetical protein
MGVSVRLAILERSSFVKQNVGSRNGTLCHFASVTVRISCPFGKTAATRTLRATSAAAVSPKQTYPRSAHERVTVLHSPRRRRLASAESSSWNTSAPGTVPRSKAPVVGHTLRRFEFEAPGGRSANEASDS